MIELVAFINERFTRRQQLIEAVNKLVRIRSGDCLSQRFHRAYLNLHRIEICEQVICDGAILRSENLTQHVKHVLKYLSFLRPRTCTFRSILPSWEPGASPETLLM